MGESRPCPDDCVALKLPKSKKAGGVN